jgi:hypothetical protein
MLQLAQPSCREAARGEFRSTHGQVGQVRQAGQVMRQHAISAIVALLFGILVWLTEFAIRETLGY